MNVMDYIVSEAYILIPVLYVIGLFLKKIPMIPDWLIPWILLGLGMLGRFFSCRYGPDGYPSGGAGGGRYRFCQPAVCPDGDQIEGRYDKQR